MNQVTLVGRVATTPELRYTQSGIPFLSFNLATDEPDGNDNKPRTNYVRIRVWRKPAETHASNITKGLLISLTGSLNTRLYERTIGGETVTLTDTHVVSDMIRYLETKSTVDARAKRKQEPLPFT
ncbi:single-stranded DNA-binding protein [Rhodococcus sp. IEGM1300]